MSFAYALTHYFYPAHSNNHKAKLLHSSTIAVLVALLFIYQMMLSLLPIAGVSILGYAANIPASEVINLGNQKRVEAGLSALSENPALSRAAKAKGEDMLAKNYWAHVSPEGTEPWAFFIDAGYQYRYAGENLARDFSSAQSAVDAWMASPSHRENLLSSKYSEIGIAVVEGDLNGVDTTIIVQFLGVLASNGGAQIAQAKTETEGIQTVGVLTLVPTLAPTLVPTFTPTPTLALLPTEVPLDGTPPVFVGGTTPPGGGSSAELKVSPFTTTKGISASLIAIMLVVLAIDAVVVARKRIPRIGGRTFAHLAFLGMILSIVLIAKAGEIL